MKVSVVASSSERWRVWNVSELAVLSSLSKTTSLADEVAEEADVGPKADCRRTENMCYPTCPNLTDQSAMKVLPPHSSTKL